MSIATNTLHRAHTFILEYTPPSGSKQPPGVGNISTVVQWVMWGVAAILFVYFVAGLVKASKARSHGNEADVSAPIWPLVMGIVLGGSSSIWMAVA